MPLEIPIYQVDAFTSTVFSGNPAAVCPLEAWLEDRLLQAIAAENNLSETAFFVRCGPDYDLRWFTPVHEVDLCGHATLASAFVIATYLDPGVEELRFLSRSGPLSVSRRDDLYTLDFPALSATRVEDSSAVAEAIGIEPRELWRGMDLMAVLDSEAQVVALSPDLDRVAALGSRALMVTAPGQGCDFVSRFFAPRAGIPEDPVTGSAHCLLTPYWARRLGKTRMRARQLSRRGGELEVKDLGERVAISGRVAPFLEGRIRV